jgi:hypothetical protein
MRRNKYEVIEDPQLSHILKEVDINNLIKNLSNKCDTLSAITQK